MKNFDFTSFDVEDVTWTLKNFSKRIKEWEDMSWEERIDKEEDDPYVLMAYAALITLKSGCGECFTIDDFIKIVNDGGFIDYDGIGHWVDLSGADLGYIRCEANWLRNNKPKDAAFVMWYNK
ncbi:MAG: hypothetical protein J5666_05495 [Bacilli bacterium]|nr:hypothetical protein [Bacilli bacterium]